MPVIPLAASILTSPLEVAARAHERNALIHDHLADPEIVVDPSFDLGVGRYLFRAEAGSESARKAEELAGPSRI